MLTRDTRYIVVLIVQIMIIYCGVGFGVGVRIFHNSVGEAVRLVSSQAVNHTLKAIITIRQRWL